MIGIRKSVVGLVAALSILWMALHFPRLTATQNGLLRFVLPLFFSLLILLRPKPPRADDDQAGAARSTLFPIGLAVAGLLLFLFGLIAPVAQAEWLGFLMLLFGCLWWGLPASVHGDILRALFLLYWAHPLPQAAFGAFQAALQQGSIKGSEWFLHMMNVRVWADGMVLRTPTGLYEIPEACSGMRTATTVFLVALGLGLLRRLKGHQCAILIPLAIGQAFLLNVLRISLIVALTPGGGDGARLLHDTAGLLMLAAVALVSTEVFLWEQHRRKRPYAEEDGSPDVMDILTRRPSAWTLVTVHRKVLLIGLLAPLMAAGLAYKSRPFHRAEMIKDVVSGLCASGAFDEAERAAETVRRLQPHDGGWALTMVRLHVVRGRYALALKELAALSVGGDRQVEAYVLEAYARMGLHQVDHARALAARIAALTSKQEDPLLAMVQAEIAFYSNNPDDTARHIVTAGRWNPNAARVRALFPYLRLHGFWSVLDQCDIPVPYADPVPLYCAIEASMNLGDILGTGDLVRQALQAWPQDPRTLEPLFFLSRQRRQNAWESRFASLLVDTLEQLSDIDGLYRLTDQCFQLARPDLAWTVLNRIARLDPAHPTLWMSAVRYGDAWFSFRKHRLRLPSVNEAETADLRGFYSLALRSAPSTPILASIPFIAELAGGNTVPFRKTCLQNALREFDLRARDNRLTSAMEHEYVKALEWDSRIDEAKVQLSRMSKRPGTSARETAVVLSEIYEHRGDWQNVYETLRTYPASFPAVRTSTADVPRLDPMLRLCRAQRQLRMGLAAIHTARETAARFPLAPQAVGMLASALAEYDSTEEALLVLSRSPEQRQKERDLLEAMCLHDTRRLVEHQGFCRSLMIPQPLTLASDAPQPMTLPPAEMALWWHRVSLPSEQDSAATAAHLRANLPTATSPFFRRLLAAWLACHARRGAGNTTELKPWMDCGRDRIEQATALSQLTLLLCRQGRLTQARSVAEQAASLFPEAPILWRMAISLANADPNIVRRARIACPDDSEIWLASIVTRRASRHAPPGSSPEHAGAETGLITEFREAMARDVYTPAAWTRAGDYLLRTGMPQAAGVAARATARHARGLLPAHVLGITCALAQNDRPWALECTGKAIASSLHPSPALHRKLIELKVQEGSLRPDSGVVQSLKDLRLADPGNPVWAQLLGSVRFQRGGWEVVDAMNQMLASIDAGSTNPLPHLIAAEASRRAGNSDRAAELIRQGLREHPGDLAMLNNLAFTLAQTTNGVQEALALLPQLETPAQQDPRVMDTVVVIYLRTGQFDKAATAIAALQRGVDAFSPLWFRANLHRAELAYRRGKWHDATRQLQDLMLYTRGIPDEDVRAAAQLLDTVTSATAGTGDAPHRRTVP